MRRKMELKTALAAGLCAAALLFCTGLLPAQDCREVAELVASDLQAGDQFGTSAEIAGDLVVVGAPHHRDLGLRSGSAYVFRFDGSSWMQEAELLASDGSAEDFFGYRVATDGKRIVVGAPRSDTFLGSFEAGAAYVFRRIGGVWVEEGILRPSDTRPGDMFGTDVDVEGDRILVGGHSLVDPGTAYVFEFDGVAWTETAKLLPPDGSIGDEFGEAVSLEGDLALVGGPFHTHSGTRSGHAWTYRFDGAAWNPEGELIPSDAIDDQQFGYSVSLSAPRAVVGSPRDEDNGPSAGSAYSFRLLGGVWTEEFQFLPIDNSPGDLYGTSVSISGELALFGAPLDEDQGDLSGATGVFRDDGLTWIEGEKFRGSDVREADRLGTSVSLDGERSVIGAPTHDHPSNILDTGGAWVFDCSENEPPVAVCASLMLAADQNCEATVRTADIDGGSFDPNGPQDIASLCLTAIDGSPLACVPEVRITDGPGLYELELTITDRSGLSDRCVATVEIIDDAPPVLLSAVPAVSCAWPPNHKRTRLILGEDVELRTQDNCDPAPSAELLSCSSDEPDNGRGDGNTVEDCRVLSSDIVEFTRERQGTEDGRVYALELAIADSSGNTAPAALGILVPHDRRSRSCELRCVPNPRCLCPQVFAPVLCADGVLYGNLCEASCACAVACIPYPAP